MLGDDAASSLVVSGAASCASDKQLPELAYVSDSCRGFSAPAADLPISLGTSLESTQATEKGCEILAGGIGSTSCPN